MNEYSAVYLMQVSKYTLAAELNRAIHTKLYSPNTGSTYEIIKNLTKIQI